MTLDLAAHYAAAEHLTPRATSQLAAGLKGSSILAIAGQVRELQDAGKEVFNLTIGDFDPSIFPVPAALVARIGAHLEAGETNYPPAVGMPQLRKAIAALYRRELDLDVPVDALIVGSGARPPIFAAFAALVSPGDQVVYPVPSWNVNHYVFLNGGVGTPVVTSPETGFMPTLAQLEPHLPTARMVVINSPQNPSGTVIDPDALAAICDAILAENARRDAAGERPLYLLFDAVYWPLTYQGLTNPTPFALRPAMAPYTVMVDAISKWWAGTGLRVGWGVAPPWVRAKMQAYVGHMGAWAARAEQLAVADLLADPAPLGSFLPDFKAALERRLVAFQQGFDAMAADGLPVRCLPAQGALYLSVQFDLIGKTTPAGAVLATDDDVRRFVLEAAGVATVPFTAFGYPEGSGWQRISVGTVTEEGVEVALARVRAALGSL